MNLPLISVVVIGRNEAARLDRCLRSVSQIDTSTFRVETIYVDSGSSDRSVEIASAWSAKVIKLESLRPSAAQGRNAGWRAAAGSIVLFLDGDTILDPHFVESALSTFADPEVAIVWGHRRETLETPTYFNRVLDLDWIYPPGDSQFCGGDALVRRSVLDATGGFDDTLIAGEEPELCRRILANKLRIVHLDLPMTGHDLAITSFGQYWRRAFRTGHAFAEVSDRYRTTAHPFWLAESRANVVRATILLALPIIALTLSLALVSGWPCLVWLALFSALCVRTAWKSRWKSGKAVTLLLYAVHSHLQQVPILFGQLGFWAHQRRGSRVELVEYKLPSDS